jgi:hypothetical protein
MGEFPFQFSADKIKKIVWASLLVAASAVITYFVNTVIPSLQAETSMQLMIVAVITSVLNAVLQWIRDNRSPEEIRALPYKQYKLQQRQDSKKSG